MPEEPSTALSGNISDILRVMDQAFPRNSRGGFNNDSDTAEKFDALKDILFSLVTGTSPVPRDIEQILAQYETRFKQIEGELMAIKDKVATLEAKVTANNAVIEEINGDLQELLEGQTALKAEVESLKQQIVDAGLLELEASVDSVITLVDAQTEKLTAAASHVPEPVEPPEEPEEPTDEPPLTENGNPPATP